MHFNSSKNSLALIHAGIKFDRYFLDYTRFPNNRPKRSVPTAGNPNPAPLFLISLIIRAQLVTRPRRTDRVSSTNYRNVDKLVESRWSGENGQGGQFEKSVYLVELGREIPANDFTGIWPGSSAVNRGIICLRLYSVRETTAGGNFAGT